MDEVFDKSTGFDSFGLSSGLLKGIRAADFEHPTFIQARLIPAVLSGRDVLGQAKTGTGKTAAFGLPVLHRADQTIRMQALILTPTRELAAQVAGELEELGRFTPIRTTCIIGGESMRLQSKSIERGGHIIVGTPGRIMDMQARRQIHFRNIHFVVLDEVDRMLDIGFRDDIRKILSHIPRDHQTIFVSATIGSEIERLGRQFMKKDAERIDTVAGSLTVSLVDQKYLSVEPWDKPYLLQYLIKREQPDTAVVFCRTKATVHRVTQHVRRAGINAREIHGDLIQKKRSSVMDSLRRGQLDVLVASDLAARGLDVEHITHVINYDLPEDPEVYVHRIGRTARVGRRGVAWSFVSPDQGQLLTEIEKLTGVLIEPFQYSDFKPGPIPEQVQRQRKDDSHATASKQMRQSGNTSPVDQLSQDQLVKMFPGGIVPKSKPTSTLGSRLRSRRRR